MASPIILCLRNDPLKNFLALLLNKYDSMPFSGELKPQPKKIEVSLSLFKLCGAHCEANLEMRSLELGISQQILHVDKIV